MVALSRSVLVGICSAVVLVAMLGCGSSSSFPGGTTGTLSGVVTLDGEPVPVGTSVTFIHGETAQPAVAVTKEGGVYTAKMHDEPKVLTGSYRVAVADPPQPSLSPEEMAAQMEGAYLGEEESVPEGVIPPKYNIPDSSGLTVEVVEGANEYDITMTR